MKLNWKRLKWFIIAGSMPPIYFNIRALIEQGERKFNIFSDYIFWFGISIGITVLLAIIILQQINLAQRRFVDSQIRCFVDSFILNRS